MKIITKKHRRLYLIPIFIVFIIGCISIYFIWQKLSTQTKPNDSSINLKPATNEQIDAGDQIKSNSNKDNPPVPENIQNSDKKSIQMNITALNQSDQYLQIRSLINAVDNTGICTLTISNSSVSVTKETVETQQQANISTCKGFDIPISKLGKGTLNIKIEYTSDQFISSTSKEFIIK